MSAFENWLVELNEQELSVSPEDVGTLLANAKKLSEGKLWIGKDGGPRPWWHRFLGTPKRYVDSLFSLEWYSGGATLIFHDENWSEYRVLKPSGGQSFPENIRKKISHGEPKPAPDEECIETEQAFRAISEALNKGCRPSWLEYRFVE